MVGDCLEAQLETVWMGTSHYYLKSTIGFSSPGTFCALSVVNQDAQMLNPRLEEKVFIPEPRPASIKSEPGFRFRASLKTSPLVWMWSLRDLKIGSNPLLQG